MASWMLRRCGRVVIGASMAAAALSAHQSTQSTGALPSGTRLQVRLTTGVSTATAKQGDKVGAIVTVDVPLGDMVVPSGALVQGTVRETVRFSSSASQAILRMDFEELLVAAQVGSGRSPIRIAAKVVAVDNARETIGEDGRILGIAPPRSTLATAEETVVLAALVPELFDVSRLEYDIRRLQHPDIAFGPGTDLTLELTTAAEGVPVVPSRRDRTPDASLLALAAAQPIRTTAGAPPRPADVINVVFVATDEQLNAAFVAAGWTTAVALGLRADTRTILAVAENRGFSQGPVSLQSYQGRPPDHVFQKQTNTFDRRHHVRIWRVSRTIDGRPVWAASATHDVGIKFVSAERTFTHRVESNIDLEREKIVNDLRFARAIHEAGYVDRPDVPRTLINATADEMTTDGRAAVVVLSSATR